MKSGKYLKKNFELPKIRLERLSIHEIIFAWNALMIKRVAQAWQANETVSEISHAEKFSKRIPAMYIFTEKLYEIQKIKLSKLPNFKKANQFSESRLWDRNKNSSL